MSQKLRITIWNEYRHEKENDFIRSIYPNGLHSAIGEGMGDDFELSYATLDEPEHGLTEEKLNHTDVLIWWGHKAHGEVQDEIVERVQQRVLRGMGLIVLHSGHFSKIFKKLMGTSCDLKWREIGEKERLWVISPGHPITEGLGEYFELEHEEMYGEHFDIPQPDELVLTSWFEGGEVFRSGCCYFRGQGKVFYFRPGHETYPTYYNENVRRVIRNAAKWAAPTVRETPKYGKAPVPLEPVKGDQ
ncbi:ThuA domain-containing protein [Paenibacillus thalictri]|uniref:Trehalose utilization protein ThuA n=1 Tax=Paenibacillus thalictri TaxID=2527873 RepID=A0A4Q9DCG0_9BACL|nr:ThuA domain-containing protein [Paenibacillus thalictri]TBL68199.1 trehalose utilization protein ThuA [Paenibacillus thalictri]